MAKHTVKCPHCGASYKIDETKLGKNGRCSKCENNFILALSNPNPVEPLIDEVVYEQPSGDPPSSLAAAAQAARRPVLLQNRQLPSQLEELQHCEIPRHRVSDPSRYRAGRPRWPIPVLIAIVVCVSVILVWKMDLFSHVGIASGETDIRKVLIDPEAYAGQVLRSRVIMETDTAFRGIGAVNATPLFLKPFSPGVRGKALRTINAVEEHQSVIIKYEIYNRSTFAKIRAREAAIDRAMQSEEYLAANSPNNITRFSPDGQAIVSRADRLWKQKQKQIDEQFGEDLGSFVGTLIDITIP